MSGAPGLSAFGNARVFNYKNFALDSHAWAAGLQLDWVIFDGGSRSAQKALAAAQAAESQARAEVLSDTIRDDLANGKSALSTKTQARQAAERSVELARETIELVRTQYENGNVTQVAWEEVTYRDLLISSEVGLIAFLVIMVIALVGQRNRRRPLRGRTAQIVYGTVLTIGTAAAKSNVTSPRKRAY